MTDITGRGENDSSKKVGLVMSGGGTGFFAHIGMLMALEDAGLSDSADIGAVIGTSAGSIAAAGLATGYTPYDLWRLTNWLMWDDQAKIPADPKNWRSAQIPRAVGKIIDPDFPRLRNALTEDINIFKGFVRGRALLELLENYFSPTTTSNHPSTKSAENVIGTEGGAGAEISTTPQAQVDGKFSNKADLPRLGRRYPLYMVATNLSDNHEAVFHFSEHLPQNGEPGQLPFDGGKTAPPAVITGGGRSVQYEYYHDLTDRETPPADRLTIAEGIRCSVSIPALIRPYYRQLRVYQRQGGPASGGELIRKVSYYGDGGIRDNYAMSVAVKIARCERIFGFYLGPNDYMFQEVGTGTLLRIGSKVLNSVMQTIYEADQDDAEIYQRQIRSLVSPHQTKRKGEFDLSQMGDLMEAGYIATAYYLSLTNPTQEPLTFLQNLVERKLKLSWDQVFAIPGGPTDGVTRAEGRVMVSPDHGESSTTTGNQIATTSRDIPDFRSPPHSNYYIIETPEAFYTTARNFLATTYPGPPAEEQKARSTPLVTVPNWFRVGRGLLTGDPTDLFSRLSYSPGPTAAEIKALKEREAAIQRRNEEKIDILPDELAQPPFAGPLFKQTQQKIVRSLRQIAFIAIFSTLTVVYTLILFSVGIIFWLIAYYGHTLALPGFWSAFGLFIIALALALVITGALLQRIIDAVWSGLEKAITQKLGV